MKKDLYIICENIRSLYNVGSVFRTADALGVRKIYLCGITGQPGQKGLDKVALGAEQAVDWEYVGQAWRLVERLRKQGIQILSLELGQGSVNIKKFKPKFPCVLVIGNEVEGVSQNLLKRSDQIIHIPMKGIKESLNVSVALGIAAYQILK